MRRTIFLLMVAGLMAPLAAHAMNEHVWLMVNGGGGTYGMSALNAELTAYNEANAGTGIAFPLIKNGYSWGVAAGFDTQGGWSYGVGLDRLHASSKAGDANGSDDLRFNANAWHGFGEYTIRDMGRSSMVVGVGAGIVAVSGKEIVSQAGVGSVEYKLSGSSPMFEGHAGGNWWITSKFAFMVTAGYRYARVREVRIDSYYPLMDSNGEPLAVDYSGPYARLGFKLAGNTVEDW